MIYKDFIIYVIFTKTINTTKLKSVSVFIEDTNNEYLIQDVPDTLTADTV